MIDPAALVGLYDVRVEAKVPGMAAELVLPANPLRVVAGFVSEVPASITVNIHPPASFADGWKLLDQKAVEFRATETAVLPQQEWYSIGGDGFATLFVYEVFKLRR